MSMAIDVQTLKNPKALLILGVAVVGGIFLVGRLKKRSSDSAPIEVPTAQYGVVSSEATQQNDQLNRDLVAAQDKYAELEKQQKQAQDDYAAMIAQQEQGRISDRDAFNQRLIDLQQQISSQFAGQLASLQATIARLSQSQPGAPVTSTPTPIPQPATPIVRPPSGTPTSQPSTPVARPTSTGSGTPVSSTPFVPGGFSQDCEGVGSLPSEAPTAYDEASIKAWIDAWRKRTGESEAAGKWRSVWFAIGGATGKANLRTWRDLYLQDFWLPGINTSRRSHGLRAMNINEFNRLRQSINNEIARQGSRDDVSTGFLSSLFQAYFAPFKCASQMRH